MRGDCIEQAIVERIKMLGLTARPYPKDTSKYISPAYPGELLVKYTGRKLIEADPSGVRVEGVASFQIVFVSREIEGESGLYKWLNDIFSALHGHVIEGIPGVLRMESEELLDEYNGLWQYAQKWTINQLIDHGQQDDYSDRPVGN